MQFQNQNRMFVVLATLLILCPCLSGIKAWAQEDSSKSKSLAVLNYQTGWSLDGAGGYHPAVYLLLENISGHDLSGVNIKVQGKFTDIHTLEPSIARMELRRALKPMQQFPYTIMAPQTYELPRDVSYWPAMECKIMARIGNVGDEGTEYLLVTKIDSVTTTQDDAYQKLNELTSYNRRSSRASTSVSRGNSATSKSNPGGITVKRPVAAVIDPLKKTDLFEQKNLPGIGDDFYNFESAFGLPIITDTHDKEMTWAKYKHKPSATDIMVGSRANTSKADIIVIPLPKNPRNNEQALLEKAKSFAGKLKSQSLGQSIKSVKYLPSGRLQISINTALGYKIYLLTPPQREDIIIMVLSRLPREADAVVRSQRKDNEVLKTLPLDSD